MAKFVCDFDMVNTYADRAKGLAENMQSAVSTYESKMNSNLSGWDGEAKSNFIASNTQFSTVLNNHINNVIELAEFLKKAADTIQTTDEELASIRI